MKIAKLGRILFLFIYFWGEELVGGGCKNCKLGRNFLVKSLAVGAISELGSLCFGEDFGGF